MITLSRTDDTVTPLKDYHQVHFTASDEGLVAAKCVCGLHAESFTTMRQAFEFLASHRPRSTRAF